MPSRPKNHTPSDRDPAGEQVRGVASSDGGLKELLQRIVGEAVRAALRDELPEMLGPLVAAREADAGERVYLSVKQAAELVGVAEATIRGWVNTGALPKHGAFRVLRVRRDELEAFLRRPCKQNADAVVDAKACAILASVSTGKRRLS